MRTRIKEQSGSARRSGPKHHGERNRHNRCREQAALYAVASRAAWCRHARAAPGARSEEGGKSRGAASRFRSRSPIGGWALRGAIGSRYPPLAVKRPGRVSQCRDYEGQSAAAAGIRARRRIQTALARWSARAPPRSFSGRPRGSLPRFAHQLEENRRRVSRCPAKHCRWNDNCTRHLSMDRSRLAANSARRNQRRRARARRDPYWPEGSLAEDGASRAPLRVKYY